MVRGNINIHSKYAKDEDYQFSENAQNGVAVIAPCCVCYGSRS